MVRDQVLRPPESLLELAHAPFGTAEQSDQLEPSRVAKQSKEAGGSLQVGRGRPRWMLLDGVQRDHRQAYRHALITIRLPTVRRSNNDQSHAPRSIDRAPTRPLRRN